MGYEEIQGAEAVNAELQAQGFNLDRVMSLQGDGLLPRQDFAQAAGPAMEDNGPETPQLS